MTREFGAAVRLVLATVILCGLVYPREFSLAEERQVPADLVATSGSGLDPPISFAGALVQVGRLANRRGISENEWRRFVERHAVMSVPSILGGEPLLNVLLLNLALDDAHPLP
jgi:K+-transporting ATPase ATPase C chain